MKTVTIQAEGRGWKVSFTDDINRRDINGIRMALLKSFSQEQRKRSARQITRTVTNEPITE